MDEINIKEEIEEELSEELPTNVNDLICGLLYVMNLLQYAKGKNITKLRNRMFQYKVELEKREHFDVKRGVYYE